MSQQKQAIVIDNGSGMCKAGVAGDDAPRSHFPLLVGIPKMHGIKVGLDEKDVFVGNQVQERKGVLDIHAPISKGIIQDWENIEKIWHYVFYEELKVVPEDHPCLLTEVPLNPRRNKEKMTEIMFDTFNVPSLYISVSSVLSLYSSGRTSGLLLESGYNLSASVPIYEGYVLPHAIQTVDLAGHELTQFLLKMLKDQGNCFSRAQQNQMVADIKEKLCYVSLDSQEEEKIYQETSTMDKIYQLPDGANVNLGMQRYLCPEALFQPKLLGIDSLGIHESVFYTLMKCDPDCLKEIQDNIVLSGGSTKFTGFIERLAKELNILTPSSIRPKLYGPPERIFSTWIGGSILSSLNTFQNMWINKADYEEMGSTIVHRKCF